MPRIVVWIIFFLLMVVTAASLTAQSSPPDTFPQPTPVPTIPAKRSPETSSRRNPNSLPSAPSVTKSGNQTAQENQGTSNDRLFWTLPNFLTVENAHNIPPLTAGEKFKVVLRTSFDPVEYPYAGFLAGIGQATDSEAEFGQGAAGYAKRYGSAFADITIENFVTGAILPSVLHQDPRYYQLGHGTFKHRLGYAISRIFVTRGDSGHNQFNASEVLGSAASAGISTYTYHPTNDRTVANTMSVWWMQVGWDTVAIGVKEFWPDIRRKVQKHHQMQSQTAPANSNNNTEP